MKQYNSATSACILCSEQVQVAIPAFVKRFKTLIVEAPVVLHF
jgi:hypothetical protein